jgi:dsRNA-specific ribonuclease
MFNDPRLADLQTALGYTFRRPEPLVRALTHPSFIEERHPGGKAPKHEAQGSLEFLGDALLDYVIARYLLEQRPLATEGELTASRAAYASGPWLEARAKALVRRSRSVSPVDAIRAVLILVPCLDQDQHRSRSDRLRIG